jgi:hypothetical protein
MSAVVVPDENLSDAAMLLELLRADLKRNTGDPLHWTNIKNHAQRLHAVKTLGAVDWITLSSVVVCKRHLADEGLNEDEAYLHTLRYLLERLSWLARDSGRELSYTVAHVVRFRMAQLREYEASLRQLDDCTIAWEALDPSGGKIDQPKRIENLQLADIVASATGAAFNVDTYNNTETRYLQEMVPRLYRRNGKLLSYGLKMHPWNDMTKATYPWVVAL